MSLRSSLFRINLFQSATSTAPTLLQQFQDWSCLTSCKGARRCEMFQRPSLWMLLLRTIHSDLKPSIVVKLLQKQGQSAWLIEEHKPKSKSMEVQTAQRLAPSMKPMALPHFALPFSLHSREQNRNTHVYIYMYTYKDIHIYTHIYIYTVGTVCSVCKHSLIHSSAAIKLINWRTACA